MCWMWWGLSGSHAVVLLEIFGCGLHRNTVENVIKSLECMVSKYFSNEMFLINYIIVSQYG